MWFIRANAPVAAIPFGMTLQNRKKVYVVDDDPSMVRGIRRLLRQHGFEAVPFDTADALRDHGRFDEACCIILDINLKGESGIDLRRHLTASGVSVPIIYITGNDSHANRLAAIESGCCAYLTKPFSARSLIEPIEEVSAIRI
jgi:FixJ family two-component response regulator